MHLFMSKCDIVGNLMSRLILSITYGLADGCGFSSTPSIPYTSSLLSCVCVLVIPIRGYSGTFCHCSSLVG